MGNYDSFKKDWENTKKEMEKLGVKKPAEKKSIGIGILKFDKRVASGIGKALKAMDEVEPKDPKKVTEKELIAYRNGLVELRKAVKSETILLDSEVDKYRGEDGKVDKDVKDGFYRCLKIFKAKLADYESSAANQLIAYQQTMGKPQDEGDKRIGKFQSDCKQRLTSAALTLKQLLLAPTPDNYASAFEKNQRIFAENRSEAGLVAGWFSNNRDVDMQEGAFELHYRSFGSLPGVERNSSEDQVRVAASAMGKLIKASLDTLSQVKTPKPK